MLSLWLGKPENQLDKNKLTHLKFYFAWVEVDTSTIFAEPEKLE